MDDTKIIERTFLLLDAEGKNVDVSAFTSAQGFHFRDRGPGDRESAIAAAPEGIKEDLELLGSMRSCDSAGVPMHAEANARFHNEEGRFRDAVGSLGNAVSLQDVLALNTEILASIDDPETTAKYLAAVTQKARTAMIVVRSHQRMMENMSDRSGFAMPKKTRAEVDSVLQLVGGRDAATRSRVHGSPEVQRDAGDAALLKDWAEGRFSKEARERVAAVVRRASFRNGMQAFVAERCVPVWTAKAAAATAALRKPDFRLEARPPIDLDPTTWPGFIAKWKLEMTVARAAEPFVDNMNRWDCRITGAESAKLRGGAGGHVKINIRLGTAHVGPPDLKTVLEIMQREFIDVVTMSKDEWLDLATGGENVKAKRFRELEEAYDRMSQDTTLSFKDNTGGEECYRELLTSVGEESLLAASFFEDIDAAPSPGR